MGAELSTAAARQPRNGQRAPRDVPGGGGRPAGVSPRHSGSREPRTSPAPHRESRAPSDRARRLESRRRGGGSNFTGRSSAAHDPAAASDAAAALAPSGPDDGLLAGAIAGYAGAGAGAVLMGIFGGLALAEESSLASGCGVEGTCSDAEVADANTFALVSDVGLGVALAGAATGTVLLIMALAGGDSDAETASVAPWVAPEGAGISTRVRF